MRPDEREVRERAIQQVTEQAAKADEVVDEALEAGLDASDPVTVHLKQFRAELMAAKRDLERELEREVLECVVFGRTAHYFGGLVVGAGHWAHTEPAPHATPKLV